MIYFYIKMKYFTFYRENNNFDDILKDTVIKSSIKQVTKWKQHMMLGIAESNDSILSYITLKFGDNLVSNLTKDFAPIIGIDYIPKRKSQ